jgi:hypothetical protein
VFVPDKPFRPSLMFASKAGSYTKEGHSGGTLQGKLLALATNIRLGWSKHSILLGPFVCVEHKIVVITTSLASNVKLYTDSIICVPQ